MPITHIFYFMKSLLASTTASILDQNFLYGGMMTSLSMSAITSKILALREARVLLGYSRDTETGGPTRLLAQLAGRWGPII
jgi:hypothetical protein